ncbi:hypothetical protein [Mycolicibacterium mengxianglii]|uniref:hypothetical protein n=1 Tax=Mycolicibacterium mengxianglii TaxID=2736649 RepID=UPI0018EF3411|nr:hypothetical protein [Mycolicibacterium mengxianglii]
MRALLMARTLRPDYDKSGPRPHAGGRGGQRRCRVAAQTLPKHDDTQDEGPPSDTLRHWHAGVETPVRPFAGEPPGCALVLHMPDRLPETMTRKAARALHAAANDY